MYTYKHPRFALGTDILIFSKIEAELAILLIQRKNNPFQDYWAFPGGFVEINETMIEAAQRELFEETGIKNLNLQALGYFDHLDRDPRDRVITFPFYTTLESPNLINPIAADDAKNVKWFKIKNLPQLAFDHHEILKDCLKELNF